MNKDAQKVEAAYKKLEVLVPAYGESKAQEAAVKKIVTAQNTEIKSLLIANNLDNFSSGGFIVSYSEAEKASFNESKLIPYLKTLKLKGLVKKREYVDMDVLEAAIYNGQLSALDLAAFQEVTLTGTLRIKAEK